MALVQDDHVIQAFAADTLDQPFDVGVLPRTPRGDDNLLDPHMLHPLPNGGAIGAVPIAQQISRCFVPWERVNDLLGGPNRVKILFTSVRSEADSPGQCHSVYVNTFLLKLWELVCCLYPPWRLVELVRTG
jgi:hypothetical protein